MIPKRNFPYYKITETKLSLLYSNFNAVSLLEFLPLVNSIITHVDYIYMINSHAHADYHNWHNILKYCTRMLGNMKFISGIKQDISLLHFVFGSTHSSPPLLNANVDEEEASPLFLSFSLLLFLSHTYFRSLSRFFSRHSTVKP